MTVSELIATLPEERRALAADRIVAHCWALQSLAGAIGLDARETMDLTDRVLLEISAAHTRQRRREREGGES